MPFKKGNSWGKGRPKSPRTRSKEEALLYITKRVTKELEPIVTKAIEQAKAGDATARKELMDRAYGKPTETHEVQGKVAFVYDDANLSKVE